jgi:hypothetical protein
MGGTDALKGFDYQITYSVLRIIELLIQNAPNSTKFIFESLNEEEEDFNIIDGSSKEFIQLKKRVEGNHWTPVELKEILSKFSEKGDKTTKFHFVTNGTGNPDVIKIKKALITNSKIDNELLDKLTPEGKTRNEIIDLLKSVQISTRFGISDDDDDPAKIIRNECFKLLNCYPFYLNGVDLDSAFISIWKLIFDYSRGGKRVDLETIKRELNALGVQIESSPWSYEIQIDGFTGREVELQDLEEIIHLKQVLCLNGINGIGKTWTIIKLVNQTDYIDKTCWIGINQWTTIEQLQFTISSYLYSANKNFLASKISTEERVHVIPAIIQSLKEHKYIIVFDSYNSANNDFKSFVKELIETTLRNKIEGRILCSSTETVFMARTQEQKLNYQEYDLSGFEIEETKAILSELSADFTDEDITRFHNSVGGHPMSIFFLKDLYIKNGLNTITVKELSQKSIEECRDYILEKSILTLDEESKNYLLSLSVFKGEIDWNQCDAQINSILNAKTALHPLLTKRLLTSTTSGINIHDSIRAVCQTIISDQFKKQLLNKGIDYIFSKMQSQFDGKEGVLYDDMVKWSDLLSQLNSINSLEEKYNLIFHFADLELDALWAIRRFGYPFDYETIDLTSSQETVNNLIAKGYVKENDDRNRLRFGEELLYDLVNLDFWQESLIIALCISRGISYHLGYIPIFKENYAFSKQIQTCWWEHCIEFMPLPPIPKSERIAHQQEVKKKFENGEYQDRTEEQLLILKEIINKKIPEDSPEEKDFEMEEKRCPMFGHCCPGGKEQSQECRKFDEDDE